MSFIIAWIVAGLLFGFISAAVWKNKGGQAANGFAAGFVLGLIGLLIVAFTQPSSSVTLRECPHCKSRIRRDASVCPNCQRDVDPLPPGKAETSSPIFILIAVGIAALGIVILYKVI